MSKKSKARKGAPAPSAGSGQPAPPSRSVQKAPPGFSGLAITGFVLSFILSPLGIVFSALALQRIGKLQQRGRGLAIAGLVLSIFFAVTVLPTQVRAMQLYIQKSSAERQRENGLRSPRGGGTETDEPAGDTGEMTRP